MKIYIKTQADLDNLTRVEKDNEVIIESSDNLKLNATISVFGILRINTTVQMSFSSKYVEAWGNSSVEAWENSSVVAWGNSSVVARENSSVEAWGNSSVVAWGNSSVVAWGNSSVVARGNSSVVARENSSVVARENSSVVARENSSVEAWENSSVEAWGNSSVEAWENSSVEARGNSSVKLLVNYSIAVAVKLFGFSVCWKPKGEKIKIEVKSKSAFIQEYIQQKYLEREGIEVNNKKVILFKRVSFDFKTQEQTKNETIWAVGSELTHPSWNPKEEECGEGKYHACSRPYFCDEFRSKKDDIYIAIEVKVADLFEWLKPQYPHKIAFKSCRVLYQCNRFGKEIKS